MSTFKLQVKPGCLYVISLRRRRLLFKETLNFLPRYLMDFFPIFFDPTTHEPFIFVILCDDILKFFCQKKPEKFLDTEILAKKNWNFVDFYKVRLLQVNFRLVTEPTVYFGCKAWVSPVGICDVGNFFENPRKVAKIVTSLREISIFSSSLQPGWQRPFILGTSRVILENFPIAKKINTFHASFCVSAVKVKIFPVESKMFLFALKFSFCTF